VNKPTKRAPRTRARRCSKPERQLLRLGAYAAPVTVARSYLYGDAAVELRRRIAAGVYPQHSKIPSLSDLTREFKVSAITVRRALHELMYEGLVVGHCGIGSSAAGV